MTIRSIELAVRQVRLVLEENLEARLLAVAKSWADGFPVPAPRAGLAPDGDYHEWDIAGAGVVDQFPAIQVVGNGSTPGAGVDASTMHQEHTVTLTVLDSERAGHPGDATRRLMRYEAAIKDLFTYRKRSLETVDIPTGSAAGTTWSGSRFLAISGDLARVDITLEISIHETK